MSNRDDEAFARKILELIVSAGDGGVERQELVAATGEDMLTGCGPGGYLQPPRRRAKH
jgi:hypothetical protein